LFGVCIEAYKSTIDGREASTCDALANLAGAALGAVFAFRAGPRWLPMLRQ
jgi:VanZ family protein